VVKPNAGATRLKHLQVTPFFFSDDSVIGGGERHAENFCKAVRIAAAERDLALDCEILAFGPQPRIVDAQADVRLRILAGDARSLGTLDVAALRAELAAADIVHVHQCLSLFGLFIAAHARLLGRRVIGTDHGGDGADHILHHHPEFVSVYDTLRAQSEFAALGFAEFNVPYAVLTGPVDDLTFRLGDGSVRDRSLVLSVGRILPHKGFEAIIDNLLDGLSLVIAGRPYDPEYRDFLRSRSRGKRVYFEEALDDTALLGLMQKAGLFVHAGTHRDYRGQFYLKPELLALAPLEFLCAGGPALVSRAGAMRELGRLTGCINFSDAHELTGLLEQYACGQLETGTAAAIRADVVSKYGLQQFGRRYLELIEKRDAYPAH
jgi:glycosyltransferase involved in cell wall biosynthesis